MARYLCPAGVFHDWSDEEVDPGGVPALKLCPQHAQDWICAGVPGITVVTQRPQPETRPIKEEKQNS